MSKKISPRYDLQSRMISLFVSLLFSIPTAALLWLSVNKQLALLDAGFLTSGYLLGCIAVFCVLALLFPQLFPSILGYIWRGMLKFGRWWGL